MHTSDSVSAGKDTSRRVILFAFRARTRPRDRCGRMEDNRAIFKRVLDDEEFREVLMHLYAAQGLPAGARGRFVIT